MIPTEVLQQPPMLAEPSKSIAPRVESALAAMLATKRYLFEPKWDGVRCLAFVDGGTARLRNRNGVDITARYPDVADALQRAHPQGSYAFDGEIIALGEDGRPDFNRLARRDRQTSVQKSLAMIRTVPVIYVAFDLIWHQVDLRKAPQVERFTRLRALATEWNRQRLWVSPASENGEAMWATVLDNGLEGLIAKRKDGTYRAGRSDRWVKLKVAHRISCIVNDWEEGKGSRAGKVGALLLSLRDNGREVEVGKAGTGFTDKDLALAMDLLRTGQPFVVEVEYANVTKDRRLRFPSFKGFRSDVPLEDCTIDQLETA